MQMSKTPIILGIDPGTQILGFAISFFIELFNGSHQVAKITCILEPHFNF